MRGRNSDFENAAAPVNMTRREFAKVAVKTLGAAAACPNLLAAGPGALPSVRWGGQELSRLLLGHNPFKGARFWENANRAPSRPEGRLPAPGSVAQRMVMFLCIWKKRTP
jgi:hypothetical protein